MPDMRILMLTSVWPTPQRPELAPFVVRQAESLRSHGIAVDVFPIEGRKRPARYFEAWRTIRRLSARGPYDLVHAQWAQSALTALPAKLPLVVTFRGSDVEGIPGARHRRTAAGWLLQNVARAVARAATEAIIVAASMAKKLPPREYHVIPSGLDLERFQPHPQAEAQAQLGLEPGARHILFAGSPRNPVKRFELAQAAVECLPAKCKAKLIVASGVDPRLMPVYMNAADALLLTSVHEGSPNVVKEALACNLPVVSTDVGDVAVRVDGIEGCTVCRTASPQAIASALAAALARGGRIVGREAVLSLDESLMTRRVIAVYERALRRAEKLVPCDETMAI